VIISLRFDMRAHPDGPDHAELYDAVLDMCEWGERVGDHLFVSVSEHHGADDGYLPSPFILAAAIAGRTRTANVLVAALILPLHDPVRIAEDVAVLDQISGGRVDVIYGAGYRDEEFATFGVDITRRAELMDDGLRILEAAWTGEPFEHRGTTVRVTPKPRRQPRPPLLLGGSSPAAARRAARLDATFIPSTDDCLEAYEGELRRLGKDVPPRLTENRPPSIALVHPDPDQAWADHGHHLLHDMQTYWGWLRDGRGGTGPYRDVADIEALRADGRYLIVTPEECAAIGAQWGALDLYPLVGGLPPTVARASLDLIELEVVPMVAAATNG
jgi:alkanesulfonate monooxygenase SsuD/methylene tetrahydromethanopterin reductase-like flavin-dependent oxidoreductase (luciferase family)